MGSVAQFDWYSSMVENTLRSMEIKTNTKVYFPRTLLYTKFNLFFIYSQMTKMELDCKLQKIGRRSVKFGRDIFQKTPQF